MIDYAKMNLNLNLTGYDKVTLLTFYFAMMASESCSVVHNNANDLALVRLLGYGLVVESLCVKTIYSITELGIKLAVEILKDSGCDHLKLIGLSYSKYDEI